MRSVIRAWTPREHGLLAWVGLPLLLALAQAPASASASALAAIAVTLGFFAFNALRARSTPGFVLAAPLAALAMAGACLSRPAPLQAALPWAAAAAAASAIGFIEGRLPRRPAWEVGALAGTGALGALVAVHGGFGTADALTAQSGLLAWQVCGLWWIRGQLARMLPGRRPWRAGGPVALGLFTLAGLLSARRGHDLPAMLPLLYAVRVLAHRRAVSPRDARRVGLTELAWGVAVALALGRVFQRTA